MTQLLTHTRQDTFKVCRKRHWFAFEVGIRRELDPQALRMGTAFHNALEALAHTGDLDAAWNVVFETYRETPLAIETEDWQIEQETVLRLVAGYEWRWSEIRLEFVAVEQEFYLPLVNPETGKPTPTFMLAGKIDGIVRLPDGRKAVLERKLLSDDLSSDAELWRRLKIDHQISMYVLAARRLGHDVECVLYDVGRKPTIRPTDVPLLDEHKQKVVLDAHGDRVLKKDGSPRQTGDSAQGYVLQTRPMEPEEWGEKLAADIAARPEFYFARVEVPRLEQDLAEYEQELWEIQQTIREAQRTNRWYRTANKHTCDFCPFFDLCTNPGFDPCGELPVGYVRTDNLFPELKGQDDDDSSNRTAETAAPTAQTAAV